MRGSILVLQQVPHEPAALIGNLLTEAGLELQPLLVGEEPIPRQPDGYQGIVIMGGPASANDATPEIEDQLQLVRWSLEHGTPMLGICLGAQLMAKAAGGHILPSPLRELGWYPLSPTPEGSNDPLFRHLSVNQPVFQWHGETFTLPPDATLLASCPQVPNQAFRLGRGQYGLQFHVEIDAALVDSWIEHGSDERRHLGSAGVARVRGDTTAHVAQANALCRRLIQSWIKEW